jgi:hypothetical protein
VFVQNARGITVRGCTFKRLCRPSDKVTGTVVNFLDNVWECNPTATEFNVANVGLGYVPRGGPAGVHRIVNGDNTSGVYQQVLNSCAQQSNAMPAAGTYVRGHLVHNNTPAIAAGKVIIGWARLTTGSAHVLDTDWAALYCTNA